MFSYSLGLKSEFFPSQIPSSKVAEPRFGRTPLVRHLVPSCCPQLPYKGAGPASLMCHMIGQALQCYCLWVVWVSGCSPPGFWVSFSKRTRKINLCNLSSKLRYYNFVLCFHYITSFYVPLRCSSQLAFQNTNSCKNCENELANHDDIKRK